MSTCSGQIYDTLSFPISVSMSVLCSIFRSVPVRAALSGIRRRWRASGVLLSSSIYRKMQSAILPPPTAAGRTGPECLRSWMRLERFWTGPGPEVMRHLSMRPGNGWKSRTLIRTGGMKKQEEFISICQKKLPCFTDAQKWLTDLCLYVNLLLLLSGGGTSMLPRREVLTLS